jgi:hypothetical protein
VISRAVNTVMHNRWRASPQKVKPAFLFLVKRSGWTLSTCSGCEEMLIRRRRLSVAQYRLKEEKCPRCGQTTSVVAGAGGVCYESSIDLSVGLC